MLNEIKEEEDDIDHEKLVCTKSNEKIFNFNKIFKIALEETKKDQYDEMLKQLKDLEKYDPKKQNKL